MRRAISFALLVGLAGCGPSPTGSPSLSEPASVPPTTTTTPIPTATPAPTVSPGAAADWFGEVAGWTLVDSLAVAQHFDALANDSVAGMGFARVQAAAEATRNETGYVVTVVAFAVAPDVGHTEQELFAAIIDGIRAGVGIEPVPACAGQALSLGMGEREVILGPWAGGPYTVFLVTDGPSTGAARELHSLLLDTGPTGCT